METARRTPRRTAEAQKQLAAEYEALAAKLTAKRQEAGRKIEKQVEAELRTLAMGSARFVVRMSPGGMVRGRVGSSGVSAVGQRRARSLGHWRKWRRAANCRVSRWR